MQMRRVAVSTLVPVVCYLTGCSVYRKVPVSPADVKQTSQDGIVELTTADGQEISFDQAGASVVNGAVRGLGRQTPLTPYEIPESQIDTRETTPQRRILSVTTVDGKEIRFEQPGAILRDGVISGRGRAQTLYEISRDKVQCLWVQRTNLITRPRALVARGRAPATGDHSPRWDVTWRHVCNDRFSGCGEIA